MAMAMAMPMPMAMPMAMATPIATPIAMPIAMPMAMAMPMPMAMPMAMAMAMAMAMTMAMPMAMAMLSFWVCRMHHGYACDLWVCCIVLFSSYAYFINLYCLHRDKTDKDGVIIAILHELHMRQSKNAGKLSFLAACLPYII